MDFLEINFNCFTVKKECNEIKFTIFDSLSDRIPEG